MTGKIAEATSRRGGGVSPNRTAKSELRQYGPSNGRADGGRGASSGDASAAAAKARRSEPATEWQCAGATDLEEGEATAADLENGEATATTTRRGGGDDDGDGDGGGTSATGRREMVLQGVKWVCREEEESKCNRSKSVADQTTWHLKTPRSGGARLAVDRDDGGGGEYDGDGGGGGFSPTVRWQMGFAGTRRRATGAIIFSQNVYDYEGKIDNEKGMKGIIRQLMVLAAAPNLPDFYPIFGPLDLQRYRKITTDYVKKINDYWAGIVKERRATKDHSKNDFLDVVIQAGFTDAQINTVFLEIFGPGSDTSSCTIEWAMSELIRNPEKLVKLQEELDKFIGLSREVRESDLENLPYLHACIKETLRLHPPVTFMLPHRTTEEFQLMNYTVPKDSQMLVNMYAIHRDLKLWDDPLSFKPERFLNSPVDYQGNDFQYLPFGSGRRICPAINMASRSNRFLLASLVHNFEWSLPDGMKPSELDMRDRFVLVLAKVVPLKVVLRARSASAF
ncbi:hypothetical protein Scep_005130 [Stephania cephalantha]|uniref:Cytochrome P450 n=1 Tax=Stephania cephalantha TaxID=152367 RepID=A0AAP0KTR2_9MAGN